MALTYRFVFHSGLILIRCDLQTEIHVFAYEFLIIPALLFKTKTDCDALEKEMTTHPNIPLAWRMLWTGEPHWL